ncbi:MAG: hypothetical protein GY855_03685 [candidate division Zixibacteria bacterium]|nr:hypothetical protein [candidate division Zixibacteria bacterium]
MNEKNNKKKQIEKEVLETLGVFDNLQDIEADHYFYTRVKQRISQSERITENPLIRSFFRFRLGPVFLTVLILINLATVYTMLESKGIESDNRDQYIEAIANQYSLDVSSLLSDLSEE